MASLINAVLISVVWVSISTGFASESSPGSQDLIPESLEPSSLRNELALLNSRISSLESIIDERTRVLLSKEESVRKMEMIVQDRSETIMMLQKEIKSLQAADSMGDGQSRNEEHEQSYKLEKEIFRLEKEIEIQSQTKLRLESRAHAAETKVIELSSKLDSLLKLSNEQTRRIQEAESFLREAQEQLRRRKQQRSSAVDISSEGLGQWLSRWLIVHLTQLQSSTVAQWNACILPALYETLQKAMEMIYDIMAWSESHLETLMTKVVLVIEEMWVKLTTYVELIVRLLAKSFMEAYEFFSQALAPHVSKSLHLSSFYLQKTKKVAEPYVGHILIIVRLHLDKACVILQPYTEKINNAYLRLVESATMYHQQAQELLKNNEITRPLATLELAWFVATALVSFPVLVLLNVCTAVLRGTEGSKNKHKHRMAYSQQRRAKRRHPG